MNYEGLDRCPKCDRRTAPVYGGPATQDIQLGVDTRLGAGTFGFKRVCEPCGIIITFPVMCRYEPIKEGMLFGKPGASYFRLSQETE